MVIVSILIWVVTILVFVILLPGYTFWKETEYSLFTPELINFFDRNTIADSVRNPKTVWLVVLMSWVVSILAYSFIYRIANKMSKFEFTPPSRIRDQFFVQHSIIIKGLN